VNRYESLRLGQKSNALVELETELSALEEEQNHDFEW
jgi:hypothetical protein